MEATVRIEAIRTPIIPDPTGIRPVIILVKQKVIIELNI